MIDCQNISQTTNLLSQRADQQLEEHQKWALSRIHRGSLRSRCGISLGRHQTSLLERYLEWSRRSIRTADVRDCATRANLRSRDKPMGGREGVGRMSCCQLPEDRSSSNDFRNPLRWGVDYSRGEVIYSVSSCSAFAGQGMEMIINDACIWEPRQFQRLRANQQI